MILRYTIRQCGPSPVNSSPTSGECIVEGVRQRRKNLSGEPWLGIWRVWRAVLQFLSYFHAQVSKCVSVVPRPPLPFSRDTLNTPFFGTRNEGTPDSTPPTPPGYAPIPPDGVETTYTWPLPGSEGYYSILYSGTEKPWNEPRCACAVILYGFYSRFLWDRRLASLYIAFGGTSKINPQPEVFTLSRHSSNMSLLLTSRLRLFDVEHVSFLSIVACFDL